jgi:hypothetical protein
MPPETKQYQKEQIKNGEMTIKNRLKNVRLNIEKKTNQEYKNKRNNISHKTKIYFRKNKSIL